MWAPLFKCNLANIKLLLSPQSRLPSYLIVQTLLLLSHAPQSHHTTEPPLSGTHLLFVADAVPGRGDAAQPPALWAPLLQQPHCHRQPALLWTPGQLAALQSCEAVQAHIALCVSPVDSVTGPTARVDYAALREPAQTGAAEQLSTAATARLVVPGARREEMALESVKRKRSRKMNKHKHRKRLKKLRMGKLR